MKSSIAPLRPIPHPIFFLRWLRLPFYMRLIIAQATYVYLFVVEVWHLVPHLGNMDETKIMLVVLGPIDAVVIFDLLVVVIIDGYDIFVSRLGIESHEDELEWLDHVNAGVLEVKLSVTSISIPSIHLLKTFIDATQKDVRAILWQIVIYMTFLVSALVMA